MTDEELIEQVAGAHRPAGVASAGGGDELRYHPAWHDLGDADRVRAFDRAQVSRLLEAALDPDGLSTTARAVLDRVRQSR